MISLSIIGRWIIFFYDTFTFGCLHVISRSRWFWIRRRRNILFPIFFFILVFIFLIIIAFLRSIRILWVLNLHSFRSIFNILLWTYNWLAILITAPLCTSWVFRNLATDNFLDANTLRHLNIFFPSRYFLMLSFLISRLSSWMVFMLFY